MGSSTGMVGGLVAVALRGAVLATVVPSAAQAESAAAGQTVRVPCSAPALSTAVSAAGTAGPTTLLLAAGCAYQITGTLTVSGSLTLAGGPSTAIRPAAGFVGRLLDVSSTGRLRVRGISLLDGRGATGDEGVGIRNAGSLVLTYVTVSGNTTDVGDGAGVSNLQGARAFITHTFISANSATGTGALGSGVGGGVLNRGVLTLFASRVSANTAEDGGAGVETAATGTTRLVQSTVDHNVTGTDGGGIRNAGTTSLDRSLVTSNRAGLSGGGIFQSGGTVTLRRSIIRANAPDDCAPANSVPGCTG
jgi:hypothetical protein